MTGSSDQSSTGSITRLIHSLQCGDLSILDQLMQRIYQHPYYRGALQRAHGHLGRLARQSMSGEDVLQESLAELYKRARRGKLETVDCRERLFGLLELIICWKARDHRRSAERPSNSPERPLTQDTGVAGSEHSTPSLLEGVGDPAVVDPADRATAADVLHRLLQEVEHKFGQYPWIAPSIQRLLEGGTVGEIARACGRTETEIRNLIETLRQVLKDIYREDWEHIKRRFGKK